VLHVGRGGQTIYEKAYGRRALQPETEQMTVDTIFDMASLTKPIATSTSIMLLAERGRLSLSDKVAQHLPAFGNHGKEAITIEQLLVHQGGLIADNAMSDYKNGPAAALQAIYASTPKWEPGTHFTYSDVGYIVLGEVVEAVSGKPLDEFVRDEIFVPLAMRDSSFKPPAELRPRIAPTEQRDGHWMRGEVHDPRAFALGGGAGHAGLFSTAADVARFCNMICQRGQLDGRRILSEDSVKTWTTVRYLADGTTGRTYGFDADTAYSGARGDRFAKGSTFGHTGFTGTSLWIDPDQRAYVILLSSSVHPAGKGNVLALRRQVATLAADLLNATPTSIK
jgi:CubicO group peptidase (beta-lactamase class C family)